MFEKPKLAFLGVPSVVCFFELVDCPQLWASMYIRSQNVYRGMLHLLPDIRVFIARDFFWTNKALIAFTTEISLDIIAIQVLLIEMIAVSYLGNLKSISSPLQEVRSPDRNVLEVFLLLFNCSVVSNSLQPHGLQQARLPCPSPSPRACSNSCSLSWWCHPTLSSSVIPFSSCLQSFPASGSFPMSQLFPSDGQSVGASASILPMNIKGWSPLEWTGLTSFAV